MNLGQYFHVGVIVPDLLAAQSRLTELLGATWGPILENDIEIRDDEGNEFRVPNRICYSMGPPYIELILEVPGTPWMCNEHSNLHHIGFYTGTVAAQFAPPWRRSVSARDHGWPRRRATRRVGLPP